VSAGAGGYLRRIKPMCIAGQGVCTVWSATEIIVGVTNPYTQAAYRVRCDWGPSGADAVGPGASIIAVVDVLSFTTTLTVAADLGIADVLLEPADFLERFEARFGARPPRPRNRPRFSRSRSPPQGA
jgi:hypothetical protein